MYIKNYIDIASKTIWQKVKATKEHGASDGRFFSEKWSVVILHRPTCGNIHGKNEWVKIEDLKYIYETYYNFIRS